MDIIRILAIIFGIVFIAVGIAGFVPQLKSGDLLLGIFAVDDMHNMVHIISGIVALLASLSFTYAKLYFQIFGIVYALVAILGFISGDMVMGMRMNMADHLLHIVIAVVSLYIGFILARSSRAGNRF